MENEIIKNDPNQQTPIKLDLINNALTVNPTLLNKIVTESQNVTNQAAQLVDIDINEIDEDEMTQLNKQIRPIAKYEKQFTDFEKQLKRELKERDQNILDNYHDLLNQANFDQVQKLTRELKTKQKDFKANRGNQRWEQLHEIFNAQMQLYPELNQYAPKTLGNFNYYRVHHPDLISEAKTKPVNNATIKILNQDLYDYHQDMEHLLNSTLSPIYYQNVIEQYAAEPSTNKMLELIDQLMVQQVKDQNAKQIQTIELKAKNLINTLWFINEKLNHFLDQINQRQIIEPTQFENYKLKLMKAEAQSILNSLTFESFIDVNEQTIDEIKLKDSLKEMIKPAFKRVETSLQKYVNENPAPEKEAKTTVPEEPYQWLLDYLQNNNWQNVHNDNKIKVTILRDLFSHITNRNSIWRQNIKSNQDIIDAVKYITNL